MNNQAMKRKLEKGECIDISQFPRLGPYYVAPHFVDNSDYADADREAWVWSIGRCDRDFSFEWDGVTHLAPEGTVLVSLDTDLYQRDGLTCLFLR